MEVKGRVSTALEEAAFDRNDVYTSQLMSAIREKSLKDLLEMNPDHW